MIHVSVTKHGYEVQDKDGNFLSWCEHFEIALQRMREIDEAEEIRRVADDVRLATKLRLNGENFWSELWRRAA